MKNFQDLEAWKVAMDHMEEIYKITRNFPKEERYGLTSQIRKAANSIVANIAEGFGRFTYPDKANKYTISRGECTEVHAFLLIAIRLGFLQNSDTATAYLLNDRTGKLLSGLIRSCKAKC